MRILYVCYDCKSCMRISYLRALPRVPQSVKCANCPGGWAQFKRPYVKGPSTHRFVHRDYSSRYDAVEPVEHKLSLKEAVDYIRSGRVCTVRFHKRSTGEFREMRVAAGRYTPKTKTAKPKDWEKNVLIGVTDLSSGGFRSIPQEGLLEIRFNGHWREIA